MITTSLPLPRRFLHCATEIPPPQVKENMHHREVQRAGEIAPDVKIETAVAGHASARSRSGRPPYSCNKVKTIMQAAISSSVNGPALRMISRKEAPIVQSRLPVCPDYTRGQIARVAGILRKASRLIPLR